jgi:hypothetical protein
VSHKPRFMVLPSTTTFAHPENNNKRDVYYLLANFLHAFTHVDTIYVKGTGIVLWRIAACFLIIYNISQKSVLGSFYTKFFMKQFIDQFLGIPAKINSTNTLWPSMTTLLTTHYIPDMKIIIITLTHGESRTHQISFVFHFFFLFLKVKSAVIFVFNYSKYHNFKYKRNFYEILIIREIFIKF